MQVRPDALEGALKRGVPAVVLIHGDEALLQLEAADLVRGTLRARGVEERQVFVVDRSFKPEMLASEASSLSLFATSKLIELRCPNKPGKELGEQIARFAEQADESTRLLVTSARLDRAATEAAWYQRVEPAALVVPVYPVDRTQLPQWIGQRLARQQQQASPATLAFLAERVEGNLLAAHQEIQKLGLLFAQGLLPEAEVRAAVLNVARFDAFDLAAAMLAADVPRTLRTLEGLRAEGEAEPLVLWAVADTLRTLLRLRQAADAGRLPSQMMRELRIFPPRDRLFETAVRRLDAARLAKALQQAAMIDRIIKGIERGQVWHALEALVCGVAGAPLPLAA